MKVVETHGHHFNNVVDAVGKAVFVVGQVQAVKAYKYRRELEDNEDPFERDHDVEELFGQEYYDCWMSVMLLITGICSFVTSRLKNSLDGNTISWMSAEQQMLSLRLCNL